MNTAKVQFGAQFTPPVANVVDLIQRNRIPGTLYISEQCQRFIERDPDAEVEDAAGALVGDQ